MFTVFQQIMFPGVIKGRAAKRQVDQITLCLCVWWAGRLRVGMLRREIQQWSNSNKTGRRLGRIICIMEAKR